MGVLMQAFYWNCPGSEGQVGNWWTFLAGKISELKNAGFTALWLPPASKAASITSMGYDPYDYYDFGDYDQKGGTKTWFGNKTELAALISKVHENGLQVYADIVINHNSGGDALERNELDGQQRWTKFTPQSKLFPRDWNCFHPSRYETMDEFPAFGGMPHLCHRNPTVFAALMEYTRFMIETVGFDGFRFDFVKGYGPWMVKGISEYRYVKDGVDFKPFCVGECWDGARTIDDWLSAANTFMDNPVSAFDFPLRYRLKSLSDSYGFSLRTLADAGALIQENPLRAVTFVDNHDTTQNGPDAVVNDKMLAYALILTHEGYPCVFWLDYFNYGLARSGTPNGIAALVKTHEELAGGGTNILFVSDDLYIMQRTGSQQQPGLILVLNNRGDQWSGVKVATRWPHTRFEPVAWRGHADDSTPATKWTDSGGNADFWAAPRGYCVYVPRT